MNNAQNIIDNNNQISGEIVSPIQTQYVDEFGNPIDPSLIDEFGNYIGETQYVDEQGNPIDPSLIDASGNYIGPVYNQENQQANPITQTSIDQSAIANALNTAQTGDVPVAVSASQQQMEGKELMQGMVTFDYNNVPITDIVNSIILDAINKGASDIHFDPFDDGIKIRIRIDGQLNDYSIVPLFVKKNMITRVKIISGMNITESRTPQDGAIRTELANKTIDLRVSCLPTNMGEKIVIRIMDYSMSASGIEALDFNEANLEKVKKMLSLPNGIILVTGATGSGKSTTVYSMLQKLNVEGTNLITVEDPIEMNIGGINQVQAVSEIGLTFASVLRSILRQDPDVIMIGEIRDDETARIAVRASITGHLVLSTIHTNNSLNTIERLTDMSVERYLLGTALSGIVSQKLARRLCQKCRHLRPTNDYEKEIFQKVLHREIPEIYEPVGCPNCSRGYRGRIAIQEVLLLTQAIQDAITKGIPKNQLRSLVYGENGTETMLQDGLEKVVEGKTSFEEIIKLIDLEDDLGSGTQLGLEDQINASHINETTPLTANGPININITPELLSSLKGLNNLVDNDDDEEIIVKPIKKKRKKKRIVEIDPEELEESLEDDEPIEILPTTENNTQEPEIIEKLEDNDEIIETLESFENNNEEINVLDDTPVYPEIKAAPIHEEPVLSDEIVIEPIISSDITKEKEDSLDKIIDKLKNTLNTIGKAKFILNTKKIVKELTHYELNESIKELLNNYLDKIKTSHKLSTDIKKSLIEEFNNNLGFKEDTSLLDIETEDTIETLEEIQTDFLTDMVSEEELDAILGTTEELEKEAKKDIKVKIEEKQNDLNIKLDEGKKKGKKNVKVSLDNIDNTTNIDIEEPKKPKKKKKTVKVNINEEPANFNLEIDSFKENTLEPIKVDINNDNNLNIILDETKNNSPIGNEEIGIDINNEENDLNVILENKNTKNSAIDDYLLDSLLDKIGSEGDEL